MKVHESFGRDRPWNKEQAFGFQSYLDSGTPIGITVINYYTAVIVIVFDHSENAV